MFFYGEQSLRFVHQNYQVAIHIGELFRVARLLAQRKHGFNFREICSTTRRFHQLFLRVLRECCVACRTPIKDGEANVPPVS